MFLTFQLLLLTTIAALFHHGCVCTTTGFRCRVENLIYAATAAQILHLFLFFGGEKKSSPLHNMWKIYFCWSQFLFITQHTNKSCIPPQGNTGGEMFLALIFIGGAFSGIWRARPVDFPVRQMVECPYETRSDSFYFADNRLVMHNKADYAYNGGQWCLSNDSDTHVHTVKRA